MIGGCHWLAACPPPGINTRRALAGLAPLRKGPSRVSPRLRQVLGSSGGSSRMRGQDRAIPLWAPKYSDPLLEESHFGESASGNNSHGKSLMREDVQHGIVYKSRRPKCPVRGWGGELGGGVCRQGQRGSRRSRDRVENAYVLINAQFKKAGYGIITAT